MTRSLSFLAALLLSTAVLAGCLGEAPAAEGGAEGQALDNTTTQTPGNGSVPSLSGAPVQVETLSYKGAMGLSACVWTPVQARCQSVQPSTGTLQELPEGGTPHHLKGTLTWTAATPAPSRMYVYLLEEDDDGWVGNQDSHFVTGASPLAFDWDLSDSPAGKRYALYVGNAQGTGVGFCPACGGGSVTTPQEFQVEAEYGYSP